MPSRGEGAAAGAISGGAAGSVFGPWGTAIGAGGGAILGYLSSGGGDEIDPEKAKFEHRDFLFNQQLRGLGQVRDRQDPQIGGAPRLGRITLGQAAQLDPAQQAQFRAMQMQQANRLGQIASGQAKGAGEMAVDRQIGQAAAQQQAMARMGRGMSGASAARGAARNVAGLGVTGAGQAQQAAFGDQMGANQMLGSVLSQGREADIGMAGQNAQLSQQRMLQQGGMDQQSMLQQGQMDQATQLANLDAQLRARGMNDAARQAYIAQIMNMDQAEMAARLGQEQVAMNQPSLMGPAMQAGGSILAAYASRQP
jgi:hypothetical protein